MSMRKHKTVLAAAAAAYWIGTESRWDPKYARWRLKPSKSHTLFSPLLSQPKRVSHLISGALLASEKSRFFVLNLFHSLSASRVILLKLILANLTSLFAYMSTRKLKKLARAVITISICLTISPNSVVYLIQFTSQFETFAWLTRNRIWSHKSTKPGP